MIRVIIMALGALTVLSAPAYADYYIVHGSDRHCRVVEHYDPHDHELIRIGPLSFSTRDEAEREVKVICHDDGYYRDHDRDYDHDRR